MKNRLIFRILAVALTLSLLLAALPASPALAASVGIAPSLGRVGTLVIVNGIGFTINDPYTITFGAITVGNGTTDGSGNIIDTFYVPTVSRGSYIVTITDTTPVTASNLFTVTPKITGVTPTLGYVGDQFTVSGNGFAASSSVIILFDGVSVGSMIALANGTLPSNATFTVPESTAGSHTIRGNDSASVNFTTLPQIAITPTTGSVGDEVTVSGNGFAGTSPITITFDNSVVAADTTNSVGSFTATFTAPAVTRGSYTIKARDTSNNEDTATFTIGEKITIVPTSGLIGDVVTVSGSGFVANSNITIIFDGVAVTTSPASVTTDGVGSFTATLTVPASSKGDHTIEAEDAGGSSATAVFAVGEKIIIDPASGLVGDIVTVSGDGFGANKSIDIYLDGVAESTGAATSDASGRFSGSLTIPATFAGSHTVEARDSDGNSATATLTIEQQITITPASGLVGDIVTVSGDGFGANKSIDIYLDGVLIGVGTATTTSSGTFTDVTFTVPPGVNGDHTVKAEDADGNSATATLTVEQQITITPATGVFETTVTVSGTGFGAGKSVTITYNGEAVTTSPAAISTGASGSFSGSFSLPAAPAGTYVVEVSDGTLSDSADFVAVAGATASETTSATSPGYVGMELTISGAGFKADAAITITYASEPTTFTTTTDSNGSFSVAITIPASVGGEHTITVSDGVISEQLAFVMEQEAPPTPQPLLPLGGDKPKQPVQFDWEEVNDDPSGVTYTLQIARDQDFTDMVLEKTGLTASEYTMTEEEKLESVGKDEPYYWRVQAVDGASNESGWTGAGSFQIGFIWPTMPDWVKYLLIGLGVVVVVVIGFWLGMRRAYSSF